MNTNPYSLTYQIINEADYWMRLYYDGTMELHKDPPKPSLWIIDVSGSMSDSMKELNTVCADAYQRMDVKPEVISFNTTAQEVPMNSEWFKLRAGGGTNFKSAFDLMMNTVNKFPHRFRDVLFFTDGNGDSPDLPTYLTSTLWPFLFEHDLTLHVVGYSKYHDIKTMASLVGANPRNSFQYAPTSQDLATVVNNISNLSQPTISITLSIPDSPSVRQFCMQADGDTTYFVWQGPVLPPTFTLTLKETTTGTSTFSLIPTLNEQPLTILDRLEILDFQLKGLATNPEKNALDRFDLILDGILQGEAWSLRRIERKIVMGKALEMKKIVSSCYSILCGNASLDDKARILTTTNAIRTKKVRLNTKLDKRILDHANLSDQVQLTVLEATRDIDRSAVPPDAHNFFCPLTACSWWEAMCDGDCIGVTLVVKRSESAIANSAMVQVIRVNADFMSMSGFHDALQNGLMKAVDETMVHGGFGGVGTIIKDRAVPECNAILPLFISEDHWNKVARHMMPLALGFMATLDERGFCNEQWHTLPYLVLAKAILQNPKTERELLTCSAIHQTCQHIVKREVLEKEVEGWLHIIRNLKFSCSICGNIIVVLGKLGALLPDIVYDIAKTSNSSAPPHPLSMWNSILDEVTCRSFYLECHRRIVRRHFGVATCLPRLVTLLGITWETDMNVWSFKSILTFPDMEERRKSLYWITKAFNLHISNSDFILYEAWALLHGDDEKSLEESLCPNPLVDPSSSIHFITDRAKQYVDYLHTADLTRQQNLSSASSYMSQVDPTWHGHLYCVSFGIFLRTLRVSTPGYLVNAKAKYLHLTKEKAWICGKRNRRHFERQIQYSFKQQFT